MLIKCHQKGSSCWKMANKCWLSMFNVNTSKISEIFFSLEISYVNGSKKYVTIYYYIVFFAGFIHIIRICIYLGDSSYFSINGRISSENICSIMMMFNCCNRMIFSSTQNSNPTWNSIPYFRNLFQNIQILAAFLLCTNLCTYWLNNRRKSLYIWKTIEPKLFMT